MSESPHIARLRRLAAGDGGPLSQDDVVIGNVGEVAPLLACKQVHAVCTSVDDKPRELRRWSSKEKGRYALYFVFEVVEPTAYQGAELMMYCRWNPQWEKQGIDYRSNLYKCACIAAGKRLGKKEPIRLSTFLKKLFLCDVSETGKAPASYSVIETIKEKLTG
jgi:hypothetical protein